MIQSSQIYLSILKQRAPKRCLGHFSFVWNHFSVLYIGITISHDMRFPINQPASWKVTKVLKCDQTPAKNKDSSILSGQISSRPHTHQKPQKVAFWKGFHLLIFKEFCQIIPSLVAAGVFFLKWAISHHLSMGGVSSIRTEPVPKTIWLKVKISKKIKEHMTSISHTD